VFYVYLLASKPYGTLYVGVTSNLLKRVFKPVSISAMGPGFRRDDNDNIRGVP
jgi:predicted GIY-YIG superfamily endonuclease